MQRMQIFACALMALGFQPCLEGQNAPAVRTICSFTYRGLDRAAPLAKLVQGKDGNFYGVTDFGGVGNSGTFFKITPAGVRTVLHSFINNGVDGTVPCGALAVDSRGNFYGATVVGGREGWGTVYRITPAGRLTTLHSFSGITGTDGQSPEAGLVRGSDGNFYGTTLIGGSEDSGTIYRITPAGVLTTLHSFAENNMGPSAGLIQGGDGNFYGTTTAVFPGDAETVFEITPAGVLTTLRIFKDRGGTAGPSLYDCLVQGSDGNFYGETSFGDGKDLGAIFKIKPAGALGALFSVSGWGTGASGLNPDLVKGSDGNIYGMTRSGGRNGQGTVFRISSED